MKAIRVHEFGGPAVLRLEEVPEPQAAAGQVLIRVKAVGVNPVDTYIRGGAQAKIIQPPYTPGSDAAGVVEECGEGVRHVKPGDRVFITGTTAPGFSGACAERVVSRAAQVHSLPDRLSFQQGAGIYVPYGTAYRSLFHRARGQPHEWVLVHGASGGVGIASVQLAHSHGFRVIGTAGTPQGRELVLKEGADHALDHRAGDYLAQVTALTDGKGPDIILEMASHLNLAKDLTILAKYGRIVVIGCRGPIEINPREAMSRDAAILGMQLVNATEGEAGSIWAALEAGFANGTLRPVVGREFPFKDAARAHEAVLEPGSHGKIVLIP